MDARRSPLHLLCLVQGREERDTLRLLTPGLERTEYGGAANLSSGPESVVQETQ
jgi:hypothetical protein